MDQFGQLSHKAELEKVLASLVFVLELRQKVENIGVAESKALDFITSSITNKRMTIANTQFIAPKANAFASTFYFFSDTHCNAKKIKRACKPPHPDCATMQGKRGQTLLRTDRRAADNSGFKKLAAQWLIEHLCFVSSVVLADSFVPRNRQLLKPANR